MRLEAKLTHPIDQSRFYKLRSKRKLAEVLCTNPQELKRTLRNASYRISQTPKADGTFRTIYNPNPSLKRVQHRIGNLLSRIEMPPWAFFARKGVCYVDNARYHEGARYLVKSDLSSFYDHCDREHVYRFFKNTMKCSPDIAEALCDLTTYTLQDGSTIIPTGSPSAQIVAFLAYREMFDEIKAVADLYKCKFSLYVDNLTFSSRSGISNPSNLERSISHIARQYGHCIKAEKTVYLDASTSKIITGVALTPSGEPKAPNALREATVSDLTQISSGDLSKIVSCLGRINAAQMIERNLFADSKRQVEQILASA